MSSGRATLLALALLALLVGAAYANSLLAGFTYDDKFMIEHNTLLTRAEYLPTLLASDYWAGRRAPSEVVPWRSGLYRPFVMVTFWLNYAWGKVSPVGYHLVNVMLHLVVTWILYLCARQVGMSYGGAFVAAAVFAVHPLHTEAVTGIVGRAELLMAACTLGALWLAARGRRAWSLAAFALALFSKEQAIVFPFVLLLYDVCLRRGEPRTSNLERRTPFSARLRAGVARYGPYVLVAIGYLALRRAVLGQFNVVPPHFLDNPLAHVDGYTRILSAVKVAGFYLWLCVWPATLSADYSYNAIPLAQSLKEPAVLGALFAWGLLLGGAGWSFVRGDRRITFAVGFLILTFLPASNLIVPIGTILGERLFYLPSAGLCLLAGLAYERLDSRLRLRITPPSTLTSTSAWSLLNLNLVLWVVLAVLCLALSIRTIERNRDWVDTETLMNSALAAYPTSAKIHGVLGGLAVGKADWDIAREHLQTAIGLYPDYSNTEVAINLNLGAMFLKTNQIEEAIQVLERAVILDSTSSQTLFSLGAAYSKARRYEEAEALIRLAIRLNPELPEAYSGLSWVLAAMGRFDEALREADKALELKPDHREARLNRARALEGLGRAQEARTELLREGASVVEPGFLRRK